MNGKKKLQVFVSSTYLDLKEERQAAVQAILSAGHIPAGMELFSAGDEAQMDVIKRWIDESDVFLLILGGRYGSVEPNSGKSYTHLEYEYALEKGLANFAVVIDGKTLEEKVKSKGTSILETENPKELKEFRSQVLKHMSDFWSDSKDIKLSIFQTLSEFSNRGNLTGWIRGGENIDTGIMAEELAKLSKENFDLRQKLNQPKSNQLYNNFSFDELFKVLSNDEVHLKSDDEIKTLFQFFVKHASQLILGMASRRNRDIFPYLNALIIYKLVKRKRDFNSDDIFTLTDAGHDFYLKTRFEKLNDKE